MTAHDDATEIWDAIEHQRTAMLTTQQDDELVSRPMASLARRDEGKIYFVTHLKTGKVGEIGGSAPVNLGYSDPAKNIYVSVSGIAHTSQDRVKLRELWSMWAEAWLPEGPDSAEVALITVEPHEGKLWDSTSSKVVETIKALKAVVTQTPPDGGKIREATL